MKYLLLSCLIVACQVSIQAQYRSLFGQEHTSWNICVFGYMGYATDSLYVSGDTVINGQEYKVIESIMFGEDKEEELPQVTYGYLREDTAAGKAWIYRESWREELVYDMSLMPGDDFLIGEYMYTVDSVAVKNGRKHVYIGFVTEYHPEVMIRHVYTTLEMIEGVGTNFGFTYNNPDFIRKDPLLLCAEQDGEQIYTHSYGDINPFYDGCKVALSLNTDNKELAAQMTVYPNPASDRVQVELELKVALADVRMELVDIHGRVLRSEALRQLPAGRTTLEMTMGDLQPGIYRVRIRSANGQVSRALVVTGRQ